MEIVIKRKSQEPLTKQVSFPATENMKRALDDIKKTTHIDVNEMFRDFAQKLIAHSAKHSA